MNDGSNNPTPTVEAPRSQRVVSLFSGCGGMDMGFIGGFQFAGRSYDHLPYEIVWANDINPAACKTYEHNIGCEIYCGDVWDSLDTLPRSADVVIGGFPCQDVSINGKGAAENGNRTVLYKALIQSVEKTQPKAFVAENVKGLTMSHGRKLYNMILDDFSGIEGYTVSDRLYLAADYGVPQMRERIFIVGVKTSGGFSHPIGREEHITAKEILHDLENREEDKSINHIWSKAAASPDQGSRRLMANSPSSTIRAEHHGNIQFHYSLNRRISMREAARIQSFPDEFIFQSALRETERQVGNAVPPVLAWHIAKALLEYIE